MTENGRHTSGISSEALGWAENTHYNHNHFSRSTLLLVTPLEPTRAEALTDLSGVKKTWSGWPRYMGLLNIKWERRGNCPLLARGAKLTVSRVIPFYVFRFEHASVNALVRTFYMLFFSGGKYDVFITALSCFCDSI